MSQFLLTMQGDFSFRSDIAELSDERDNKVFYFRHDVLEADPNDIVTRVDRREQDQHENGQQIPGCVTLRPLRVLPVFVTTEIPAYRTIQFPY